MGFPMGFKELRIPAFLLHALYVLAFFRKLVANICRYIGLPDFLAHEIARPDAIRLAHRAHEADNACASAALIIDDIVPVLRYSDVQTNPEDCCSVCLVEFGSDDKIRRLPQCGHVFHRICLDRWIVIYRKMTCPICRNWFVQNELTEYFNQAVWGSGSRVFGLHGEIGGYYESVP